MLEVTGRRTDTSEIISDHSAALSESPGFFRRIIGKLILRPPPSVQDPEAKVQQQRSLINRVLHSRIGDAMILGTFLTGEAILLSTSGLCIWSAMGTKPPPAIQRAEEDIGDLQKLDPGTSLIGKNVHVTTPEGQRVRIRVWHVWPSAPVPLEVGMHQFDVDHRGFLDTCEDIRTCNEGVLFVSKTQEATIGPDTRNCVFVRHDDLSRAVCNLCHACPQETEPELTVPAELRLKNGPGITVQLRFRCKRVEPGTLAYRQ